MNQYENSCPFELNLARFGCSILRNNSFYGGIPQEFGQLLELEVLDLGFNNLSGLFPLDLGKNLSLTTL